MNETNEQKTGPTKSFMTVGPTLHYSHANVRRCWAFALIVYFATCSFWSMILTGNMAWIGISGAFDSNLWSLGNVVLSPLSIFEYPWQIYVLGMLMGIMAASPVIVAQLLSFRFTIPMILSVIFVAKLPLFGLLLLASCIAVACRPLRFRSRFIAILLCMAPQIAYWAAFGGIESIDPIQMGFSYSPWVCAWINGLVIAGIVIGVGHYTRYRPGLVWIVTAVALILTIGIFNYLVKFDELDYQLYVAGHNPEKIEQFQEHLMTESIDAAIHDDEIRIYLAGLFYSPDTILLREELKNELRHGLDRDRWPVWFNVPDEIDYHKKRTELISQYNKFLEKRPKSDRIPIALYYKAMLMELSPDTREFGRNEILKFSNNHPSSDSLAIWWELSYKHATRPEALEAKWRIAMNQASNGRFEKARELCQIASMLLTNRLTINENAPRKDTIWTAFSKPAKTVMTRVKLQDLNLRLKKLELLIGEHNLSKDPASKKRLARFIMLNENKIEYPELLELLLSEVKEDDPLMDNILLAKAMSEEDLHVKSENLKTIIEKYEKSDGGMGAKYEMGVLSVRLWKNTEDEKLKENHLQTAKSVLANFISEYPESIFNNEAQAVLEGLPVAENE